mmetsp:Transcript_117080/g.338425  ORF Transcript_117080/g.338425 Transcript_117080/m.338425 type:complete len:230 (+) Transcript_117080:3289-3978(+)
MSCGEDAGAKRGGVHSAAGAQHGESGATDVLPLEVGHGQVHEGDVVRQATQPRVVGPLRNEELRIPSLDSSGRVAPWHLPILVERRPECDVLQQSLFLRILAPGLIPRRQGHLAFDHLRVVLPKVCLDLPEEAHRTLSHCSISGGAAGCLLRLAFGLQRSDEVLAEGPHEGERPRPMWREGDVKELVDEVVQDRTSLVVPGPRNEQPVQQAADQLGHTSLRRCSASHRL